MSKTLFTQECLLTDDEFQMFSFHNNETRLSTLEDEIKNHKRTPTVYAWNHYILDGHKQYTICQNNHIPYCLVELDFPNKDDALVWIFQQLLSEQSYYPKQAIRYCIGKYYLVARKHSGGIVHNIPQSDKHMIFPSTPASVSEKIGEESGFHPGTVRKYAALANNLDRISKLSPFIFKIYLEESLLMSYEVIRIIARMEESKLISLERYFSTLDHVHVPPESIDSLLNKTMYAPEPKVPRAYSRSTIPIIKTMPVYDADSALSSLILTIPSWISSIERTENHADFAQISIEAKEKLLIQLLALTDAITNIKDRLEPKENDR